MNLSAFLKNKWALSFIAFAIVGLHLLWEYTHGGIMIHNVLAREDLPAISNWWGLVTVPILAWITGYVFEYRSKGILDNSAAEKKLGLNVARGFGGALLYGLSMTVLWQLGLDYIMQYWIMFPLVISLFVAIYYPEVLLGYTIGSLYSFGGVLPIGIGSILLLLCFIVHQAVRLVLRLVRS